MIAFTTLTDDNMAEVLAKAAAAADTRVTIAKQAVVSAVDSNRNGYSYEDVASALVDLAQAEGALSVYNPAAVLAANAGVGVEEMTWFAVHQLRQSTDDTWSGRRNDARRAYADGRRDAAKELLPATNPWRQA